MDFQELGLTLQREREAKGMTIEAVMEATKISRINLVALEKGDRSSLPHPVYTKGFIKSYARLLELDADELSMVVDREYQSEAAEVEEVFYDVSPAAEKAFQEMDAPKKRKRPVWPSILVFLAVAVAVVLLVLNLNKNGQQTTPSPESAQISEAPVIPAAEQVEPQEEPVQDVAPLEEPVPAEQAIPEETAEEAVPGPGADATAPPPESGAQAPESLPDDTTDAVVSTDTGTDEEGIHYAHVLIIRATTDKGCWVGLWKGDEVNMARDFVLKKGEPLRLMFNNPRRIRIGNVAGVEVTYNGQPYPLEDNKSNIQTLVFDAN